MSFFKAERWFFHTRTRTVHPPDLDLAVICSWHNERHAGMEGCPVYASIVTLRPEQENTNFHSSKQHYSFNTNHTLQHQDHYNRILTSRTCFTTASDAPNRSTPEMPRTSVSTAPGDKFFFLRPGSNIYSPTHTGDPFTNYTGTSTYRGGKREEQH